MERQKETHGSGRRWDHQINSPRRLVMSFHHHSSGPKPPLFVRKDRRVSKPERKRSGRTEESRTDPTNSSVNRNWPFPNDKELNWSKFISDWPRQRKEVKDLDIKREHPIFFYVCFFGVEVIRSQCRPLNIVLGSTNVEYGLKKLGLH